jgi:hypothetical protein
MQKITINTPLFTVEITGENERELFKPAGFWLSLPRKCPVCQKPLTIDYRLAQKKFHYYELICTGEPVHKLQLGQSQTDQSLYYDAKKPWTLSGGREFDPHTSDAPDVATPKPASAAATNVDTSPAPADPADRNKLLNLIKDAAKRGIRTGIIVGDVPGMNLGQVEAAIEKIGRELLVSP